MRPMTRIDSWTHEQDVLLAETVLQFMEQGDTALNAFHAYSKLEDRTPGASAFRWNTVVRTHYKEQIHAIRKERNQKKRSQWISNISKAQTATIPNKEESEQLSFTIGWEEEKQQLLAYNLLLEKENAELRLYKEKYLTIASIVS